jgi:hypothetical protein
MLTHKQSLAFPEDGFDGLFIMYIDHHHVKSRTEKSLFQRFFLPGKVWKHRLKQQPADVIS